MAGRLLHILLILCSSVRVIVRGQERLRNCNIRCGNDLSTLLVRPPRGPKGEPGADCTECPEADPELGARVAALETSLQGAEASAQAHLIRFNHLEKKFVELQRKYVAKYATSCEDFSQIGISGVQELIIDGVKKPVLCDANGFAVVLHRSDGSVSFERGFSEYEAGFGDAAGQHWIGLATMNSMTRMGRWTLRVELESFDGEMKYAEYEDFSVGEGPEYKLSVGRYSGTAGDALRLNDGYAFTTTDVDQDIWSRGNCARHFRGAWWHGSCGWVNLNPFAYDEGEDDKLLNWKTFHGKWEGLKSAIMKIVHTD